MAQSAAATEAFGPGRAGVVWAGLAAAYLLLAGQVAPTELVAGAGASLAAGLYAVALRRTAEHRLRLHAPWTRVVVSVASALVTDSARVGWDLLRGRPGVLAEQPFVVGPDGPEELGRRAVVMLSLSAAPNGYVVGCSGERLVLHRLGRGATKSDRRWPL